MLTTASLYELNEITPGGGENESGVYGLLGDVSPLSSPTYISVLPFDFNCGEHWAKNPGFLCQQMLLYSTRRNL